MNSHHRTLNIRQDETRRITDIEPQEKRKYRFSIFLNGEFAFGIHQDVLLQSGIAKGDALSQEKIEHILELERRRSAKEKAYRLLAVRPRSEKEMRDRLARSGYTAKDLAWVIEELLRLKLINDVEFAIAFARNRMIGRPCGRYMLRQELQQKGIDDSSIDRAIAEAYKERDEYHVAWQIAAQNKKKQMRLDEDKARKRVGDFLMRRGFGWDIVNDIAEHWDDLTDESDQTLD
ncbi:RecX family transcriptional regulator [candidate division KSB1 bacterium]|nr:RecX family transcriptional regulator [candidate division KSB1 bacterium]